MASPKQPVFETIYQARTLEEIIIYSNKSKVSAKEKTLIIDFLKDEYETECLHYPYIAPEFNSEAAFYGAMVLFFSCQMLLYRDKKVEEFYNLIPAHNTVPDASHYLSADLCLRFMPQVLVGLRAIDVDDPLITIIDKILLKFSYSGIGEKVVIDAIDFENIIQNKCLHQLYINRVIERKAMKWAMHKQIKQGILETTGMYAKLYWPELNFTE